MDHLRKKFETIYQSFIERKSHTLSVLKSWQDRGYQSAYERGSGMVRTIEEIAQNIRQELALQSQTDQTALKKNVKRLKKQWKELREYLKPVWRQWVEAIVTALFLATILRHTIFSPYHVPTGSAEPTILVGDRIWGNKLAYLFNEVKCGDYIICDEPTFSYEGSNIIQRMWQRFVGFPLPMIGLPSGPISVTKRVIAGPGDTIEGRIEEGKTAVYVNGERLEEPYLNRLPLIYVQRDVGFIPWHKVGPLSVPGFLRQEKKYIPYVYDPSKPLEQQPYYYMSEATLARDVHGDPILRYPYTPNKGYHGYSEDIYGPLTLPEGMYWCMGDSRKNSGDSRIFGPIPRDLIRGRVSFVLFSLDSEEVFWLFDLIKHPIDFWTKHVRWNRFFKNIK